jgi:nucleoside-diphosphate-sugar epimerase
MNLGGHEVVSMNEVIQMIEKYVGKRAKIEHRTFPKADMLVNWADVTKAEEILGWKPQYNLEVGIQKSIDWYLENRAWASQLNFTL